eukprot:tig00020610_g11986.t1
MLECAWTLEGGWETPVIRPYGSLQLSPACSALHYALQCFEGLKVYRDEAGKIRMFRPELNMNRMNSSAARLALPTFSGEELIKMIKKLVLVDQEWVPRQPGCALYIRPTLIGNQDSLGVAPSHKALLYVILSPMGTWFPQPVKLMADERYVRAWPGGTGAFKVGGNYAMSTLAMVEAARDGCNQVLWLFGEDAQVTEVGMMNVFFLWRDKAGALELITAPLDGTILPGVTRDSIVALTRQWGEFKVTERPYYMKEIVEAISEGRMVEGFGSGTAAVVTPIRAILYQGKELEIPVIGEDGAPAKMGAMAHRIREALLSIQYGRTPSPWSIVVE